MEREEILERAKKRYPVGESEDRGLYKSLRISLIAVGSIAVLTMIFLGLIRNFTGLYFIGFLCMLWASVFYFLQYSVAKRRYFGIILGGVLCLLGSATYLTFALLFSFGVLSR